MQGEAALSKSFFLRLFYGTKHVHHASLNDMGCPICNIVHQEKVSKAEMAKFEQHKSWWYAQARAFKTDRARLRYDLVCLMSSSLNHCIC